MKKEGSDEDASFRRDSGVGDSFVGSMSSLNQDSENVFSLDSPKVIQPVLEMETESSILQRTEGKGQTSSVFLSLIEYPRAKG